SSDDSSDDSSEEESKPAVKKPAQAATPKAAAHAKAATPAAAAKKAAESSEDSSDDSSEEESTTKKPAQVATPKAAGPNKTPAKAATAAGAAKKEDSSDDSSDDSSEEESKPTTKMPAQVATQKAVAAAVTAKRKAESSDDSDSSEDAKPAAKKPAVLSTSTPKPGTKTIKKASSSDSDSDEDENVTAEKSNQSAYQVGQKRKLDDQQKTAIPPAKKPNPYSNFCETPPNKKQTNDQNGSASSGFGSGRKSFASSNEKTQRFRRIKEEEIQIDHRLQDNSYEAKTENTPPKADEQTTTETKPDTDVKKPNERRGQWMCTGCSAINYAVRRICPSCKVARTTWKCKECYEQNEVKDLEKDECKVCETVAPYVTARNINEKTGKWTCFECNATNKEEFDVCFCAKQSTTTIEYDDGSGSGRKRIKSIKFPMKLGDWNCPDCHKHNFAKKLKCVLCFTLKPRELLQQHGKN
uniref:RanBP2-type domain-containing protein n=1 Tax=Anopheles christyi TaxID=43041 RepID=A0A182KBV2_9DIPT